MKFVADENVDKPIVDALRTNNYEVYFILEENRGISDQEVLKIAHAKNSILLTADKDFGELVFRQKQNHHGIILYRLAGLSNEKKIDIVLKVLIRYYHEFENHFSVISKTHIRIIKL